MDYFRWIARTNQRINPDVAERYLKNAYAICEQAGILDVPIESAPPGLPFEIGMIPQEYSL